LPELRSGGFRFAHHTCRKNGKQFLLEVAKGKKALEDVETDGENEELVLWPFKGARVLLL
jgi:hypothetical protein